jgi:hypothetical protein
MLGALVIFHINQELHSLYLKNQELNKQLNKTHLKYANTWVM